MSGIDGSAGVLEPFADRYRVRLRELGYRPGTIDHKLRDLGKLGRWMAGGGIEARQLDGSMIESFLLVRRAVGDRPPLTVQSFPRLLEFLRSEGVIAPERPSVAVTALDQLLEDYRGWLVVERQLAPSTVRGYVLVARRFLEQRTRLTDGVGVSDLTGADVTGFLLGERGRSVDSARRAVSDLRALLRFLQLRGLTDLALGDSVPPVAGWRDSTVPKALQRADVERLLSSCDRSSLVGARDFAVLMLLARLGLRSIEVTRLQLEDLDWRHGEICVCGKGGDRERLPLPGDVGEALAAYLSVCDHRGCRSVFVTFRAPTRPILTTVVRHLIASACRRAGLPRVAAHRLRHTLATELLLEGASLIEIGQVLRHRSVDSTAVYAKVDLARLRAVARPWPETGR
jgi:integrase/recombinase XerD